MKKIMELKKVSIGQHTNIVREVYVGTERDVVACRITVTTNDMFYDPNQADIIATDACAEAGKILAKRLNSEVEQ